MEECKEVLESFLNEMKALDQQQKEEHQCVEPKKTGLDEGSDAKETKAEFKKKRANPSWLKRKRELQSLQQQTRVLETQVVMLQTKNVIQQAQSRSISKEVEKKWKAVVEIEKQRVRAAQDDNEQAKVKLRRYMRQAVAVKGMLEATQNERDEFLRVSMAKSIRVDQRLQSESADIFTVLEGRVDARFLELQPSFCTKPKPMAVSDTEMVQSCCDLNAGKVELSRAQLLPFEIRAIFSAIWSIIDDGRFPDRDNTRVVRWSKFDDTYALTACTTINLECGAIIYLKSVAVLKRFMTPGGFVVLTEADSEYVANSPTSRASSHMTREEGCFAVRKYPVEGDPESSGVCHLNSAMHLQSIDSSHRSGLLPVAKPGIVHDGVISSFRQLFSSRNQFMENALFDTIRSRG